MGTHKMPSCYMLLNQPSHDGSGSKTPRHALQGYTIFAWPTVHWAGANAGHSGARGWRVECCAGCFALDGKVLCLHKPTLEGHGMIVREIEFRLLLIWVSERKLSMLAPAELTGQPRYASKTPSSSEEEKK